LSHALKNDLASIEYKITQLQNEQERLYLNFTTKVNTMHASPSHQGIVCSPAVEI
jgi:hypothetical protein